MKLFRWGLLGAFIAGVLIFTVLQGMAGGTLGPLGSPLPIGCGGGNITYPLPFDVNVGAPHDPLGHYFVGTYTTSTGSNTDQGAIAGAANWLAIGVPAAGPDNLITISASLYEGNSAAGLLLGNVTFTYDCTTGALVSSGGGGGAAAPVEPPPPSADIFLSDVCEPFAGFSADGWMTWNTNAVRDNLSWQLYIGSSIDGPWIPVTGAPPWIIDHPTMDAIAQAVGVANYHDVWLRVEGGKPVNVGSAIIGRDYRMLELCGGELPAAPVPTEPPPQP